MTSSDLEIDIDAITTRAIDSFAQAVTSEDLKEAEREFLGKASNLAFLSASISKRPIAERSNVGKLVGDARQAIQQALERRRTEVTSAEVRERLQREYLDVTALPARARLGARHPLSLLQDHVSDLFVGMGWEVAEGPELEHAWFNFDALNTDIDHPARTSQDTFYTDPIGDNLVLRSQTSAVQVRALLERELPVFIVTPGRVFRRDEYDATHLPVFHQIEGLAVAEGLSMAHLKGTLEYFARQMFGDSARIRFRANFFPFTEPSAELDVWHDEFIGGARWIEWGGCGMINANVLRAAGVDPEKYSGFAFGMGLERTLMFRNAVADMRAFAEGDVRFSGQFGFRI